MPVGDILANNAANWPERPAVVSGGSRITFARLHAASTRLAQALRALADPGDRVAILARNRHEYVEAMYGVTTAGLVLVLLNYRLHPREWAWILADAEAAALLVEAELYDELLPFLGDAPSLKHVIVYDESRPGTLSYDAVLEEAAATRVDIVVDDADTAFLIYTSGTTGFPKGAMISHRAAHLGALVNAMECGVRPGERYLMAFPMCHASGFQVFQYHLRGAQFVLMPAFDAASFVDLVEQHEITRSSLAPTMADFLLADPSFDARRLPSLRTIGYGGMPMALDTARALAERFELFTGFGQTESTLMVSILTPDDHARALDGDEEILLSCGRPMGSAAVMVLGEDGRPPPVGDVGELCVRSPFSMSGYWRDEEATRQAFAGGWLRTGDMARRDDDGYLYLVDRKKDLIISGGQNIYPTEIERVIRTLPSVAEVAVVGLPDPVWGERVVAVVVKRGDVASNGGDVVDVCRRHLASYKKPKEVVFVDSIPKTVTGKVLKRELRAALAALSAPQLPLQQAREKT